MCQNGQPRNYWKSSTYLIVSIIAYLIGVGRQIFENEHEPPRSEAYQELDKDRDARIIRNLCILRTAIERNYTQIYYEFKYDLKNINTLPQLIPQESLLELEQDGVSLYRANHKI